MPTTRRRFLKACTAAAMLGAAGCSGAPNSRTAGASAATTSPGLAAIDLDAHFPRYRGFDPAARVWCVTPEAPGAIHRFFDTSPVSPSGRYLAVTQFPFTDRLPEPGNAAKVVLVDLATGAHRTVAETRGWDTQLGAQVQWGTTDEALYFNDVDTRTWQPFGVRLDPLSGRRRRLKGTVYMLAPDGRSAVSACLRRITTVQAGYGVIVPPEHVPTNQGAPNDDGVYVTDTETGACRLVASLRRIVEAVLPAGAAEAGTYYAFHTKVNPQSTRIMLVLRLFAEGSTRARSQLVTMKADGSDIHLAIPASEWADKGGHHPNWCPDGQHVMMNLKLHGRKKGLWLVRARYDGAGLATMTEAVPGSGHPSLHPNGRHVVTDCYLHEPMAFEDGTVPLRLIDLQRGTETPFVRIGSKPAWKGPKNELRVDPHPAWDPTFRFVAFNACPDGPRKVYLADLGPLLKG